MDHAPMIPAHPEAERTDHNNGGVRPAPMQRGTAARSDAGLTQQAAGPFASTGDGRANSLHDREKPN